jgi:hypothetical protein
MFRTVPLSIIRSFSLYTQQLYMSHRFADSLLVGSGCHPYLASKLSANLYDIRIPLLCVQWKTPDDGQRNCPKHVEFHSKNKTEKLAHLVGFIIRNLSRCTVTRTLILSVQHTTYCGPANQPTITSVALCHKSLQIHGLKHVTLPAVTLQWNQRWVQRIFSIWYDIFVNCNWVATRRQSYSTHLHTNNTEYDTKIYKKKKIHKKCIKKYV